MKPLVIPCESAGCLLQFQVYQLTQMLHRELHLNTNVKKKTIIMAIYKEMQDKNF